MKRLGIILLLLSLTLAPYAQQKRTKPAATKSAKTSKSTQSGKKGTTAKGGKSGKAAPMSVQALERQRTKLQQEIKEQERRLRQAEQDVKRRLRKLMLINSEIQGKQRTIDTIRHDIGDLDEEIVLLADQLEDLRLELNTCKKRYVKSMRYMHRNHSAQSQLMFIFSADNFAQMVRRLRFMKEYAAYQHVQGDEIKAQQDAVNDKFQELNLAKLKKTQLLDKGEREQRALEGKQQEQQNVVNTLQKEQKTIRAIIAEQKKKDAALNAQIDRMIAEEIARQKARAAAEAKRKAEAEARRKAEAEARARRLAEAKAREEKAKAEALAAKNRKEKEEAARKLREAEKARQDEERRVAEERSRDEKHESELVYTSDDQRISGSFENNRGRLPMPITGGYRIISHFGQYSVEGLRGVMLDNKGIYIKGEPGAQARSIFDGEVSAVFSSGSSMVVMVRHGSYISVYCDLASVNVHRGQRVSTRQTLGRIGKDNVMQFQLRRETAKLNPESWLAK